MAYIELNDTVIAQVRQSADIVDFVNPITPLKPAGKRYKGLCPFHREKTPSFTVDRDKGLFHCFGCGEGGDLFKFLMLVERFTFPEALEHVASRVGIALPRRKSQGAESGKDDLLTIVEEAAAAFHQALQWKPNPAATYLEKRGVAPEIWTRYGFGYAPDSWDYVLSRLGRKYASKQLEAAGLVLPRRSGDGYYDRFRNRLIVPIHSEAGTVIGFGGRSLDGSDPKYLNSPESPIFNKSALLYNLHRAKHSIRKMERAILVEGYFDCLTLDHEGVPGTVASMGTALTTGQASLLRRFTRRVVIAYDGDEAGRNATLRAAPVLLAAGLAVQVADVGTGEDPDSYVRKFGADGFLERLSNATDIFEFALGRLAPSPAQLSSQQKGEAVETITGLLASVDDPVTRNDAAHRVADHLRLEFETVWQRIRRGGDPSRDRVATATVSTGEKKIVRAVLEGQLDDASFLRVREEFFDDPACSRIFATVAKLRKNGQPLDFSRIATEIRGEADLARLSELVVSEDDPGQESLEETLRQMERRFLERRSKQIQIEIQDAEKAGDSPRLESLYAEKQEVMRRKHALK